MTTYSNKSYDVACVSHNSLLLDFGLVNVFPKDSHVKVLVPSALMLRRGALKKALTSSDITDGVIH